LEDGRILSWSIDGTLRLWDGNSVPLATLEGHQDTINGALALPDGRILSWSEDRTLRLWGGDGRPRAMWAYPPSPITHVVPHSKDPDRFWVCAGREVILIAENTAASSSGSA
jgi:WD40 repeat protein